MQSLIVAGLLFGSLALAGCVSAPPDKTLGTYSYRLHGRFCGPDYPHLPPMPAAEQVQRLSEIPAVDALDQACKIHDICYVVRGMHDPGCDGVLVQQSRALEQQMRDPKCKRLARLVDDVIARKARLGYMAAYEDSQRQIATLKAQGNYLGAALFYLNVPSALAVDGLNNAVVAPVEGAFATVANADAAWTLPPLDYVCT